MYPGCTLDFRKCAIYRQKYPNKKKINTVTGTQNIGGPTFVLGEYNHNFFFLDKVLRVTSKVYIIICIMFY